MTRDGKREISERYLMKYYRGEQDERDMESGSRCLQTNEKFCLWMEICRVPLYKLHGKDT
jgi:hypothetical protein